jgi:hypothetical protein
VISLGESLLDYPAMSVLSYVEFVIRDISEDNESHMNDLYDIALISRRDNLDSRRNAIMEAMAAFGGD